MTKRQGLDKSHLASIFYNPVATNSILKNGLSLPNPPKGPDAPPDPLQPVEGKVLAIPPFDSGSVVVKAIWEIVQQDASKNWPVAVYDPEFPANELNANGTPTGTLLQPSPLSGSVGWNTVVNLDVKNDQVCNDSSGKAIGTIILTRDTPTIPLGCFHFAKVPAKSPEGSFVRTITTGGVSTTGDYYLLLVGMHIAKKEGNQWTWTTFWWTNRPDYNGGLDFKEQPTDLPAAYGHFAMNTTVSGQAVVYNPYLEGTQGPNGTMSNCAHCHGFASITLHADTDSKIGLIANPTTPNNSRMTDFMWGIATARDSNPDYF